MATTPPLDGDSLPSDDASPRTISEKDPAATRVLVSETSESTPTKDGGLRGWSIVLADWIIQFFMAGAITSFGVFQSYYTKTYLTRYSAPSISWIGTVQGFLELGLGFVGGRLLDGGKFHTTVAIGSILFVFSFFMLSLAHNNSYYQIFLTQGLGMGTGLGIAFLPTSGAVAHHFTKNRALAMGIATTGVSLGGFAWSTLFSNILYSSIGFAWAIRIAGFVCLAALLLANGLFCLHPGPSGSPETNNKQLGSKSVEKRPSILSILRDPPYCLALAFAFVYCLGLYFPPYYIELFAQSHGIPNKVARWSLSIINLCAVPGRVIPNWIADRFGIFRVYIFCLSAAGILCFVMPACTSTASLIAFCIVYGFFSGSLISLFFPTFVELSPNPAEIGVRLGLASSACAVAVLIGTPIASALVGDDNKWYKGTTFSGLSLIVGAAFLTYADVLHRRKTAHVAQSMDQVSVVAD